MPPQGIRVWQTVYTWALVKSWVSALWFILTFERSEKEPGVAVHTCVSST